MEAEAADGVALLELALALLRRRVPDALRRARSRDCPPPVVRACAAELVVARLAVARSPRRRAGAFQAGTLKFGVRWNTVSVRGLLGDHRDRLDAGRAGADHADALAGEVDALVRPAARCGAARPRSARGPGMSGMRGDREAARRHDQEAAPRARRRASVATVQRSAASSKRGRGDARARSWMSRRRSKRSATWSR